MTGFPGSPRLAKAGLALIDPASGSIVRIIALRWTFPRMAAFGFLASTRSIGMARTLLPRSTNAMTGTFFVPLVLAGSPEPCGAANIGLVNLDLPRQHP